MDSKHRVGETAVFPAVFVFLSESRILMPENRRMFLCPLGKGAIVMKLIIGLGNPGADYADTRHNIGFMVVDKLARELGTQTPQWQEEEKFNAMTVKIGDVMLIKPISFMNRSGEVVAKIMRYYKLTPADIWVIHDDLDLPIGKIRIREKGSSAGHNGVKSMIEQLHSDSFVRFRLGIGRAGTAARTRIGFFGKHTEDDEGKTPIKDGIERKFERVTHQSVMSFVLSKFTLGEAGSVKHLIKNGSDAVRMALTEGIDRAMTRYN